MENKTQNGCSRHCANWAQVSQGYGSTRYSEGSWFPARGYAIGRALERLAAKLPKPKSSQEKKTKITHRAPIAPPTKPHPDRKKKISRLGCRSGYGSGQVCSATRTPSSITDIFFKYAQTLALKALGTILVCAQCHKPATYDREQHHRHSVGSEGGQCVNCHMPAQVYMGVDWRRDHSMRVPRPDLTLATGSPNACSQCHTDQSASWAVEALRGWGLGKKASRGEPARAFHGAQRGDIRALPSLKTLH